MTVLLDIVRQVKDSGDFGLLTTAIPYARFLGITAERIDGELVGKLTFSPELVGNVAILALHGGTIGALLESTAIFHLIWESDATHIPKTIDITIDYLRSARAVDTFARGIITRHGRRVANVRVEAWQDDRNRTVATAHAHFLLGD